MVETQRDHEENGLGCQQHNSGYRRSAPQPDCERSVKMMNKKSIVSITLGFLGAIAICMVGTYRIKVSEPVSPLLESRCVMQEMSTAIDTYECDQHVYPASETNILTPTNYMVRSHSIIDGWGSRLRYTYLTNGYEIRSAGADKAFNTPDDLIEKH